jgi:hypothetical protein
MKCETTNLILTAVLGALVVLAVFFALRTINQSRELNTLQIESVAINQNYLKLQSLANEVSAYNQKYPNPELTRILQGH